MDSQSRNPYQADQMESQPDPNPAQRRWVTIATGITCLYYGLSSLTLPLANYLWLGEVPVLALIQLPKSFLKSIIQAILLRGVHAFGLSQGSPSPDSIATHGWALLLASLFPALVLIGFFLSLPRGPKRRILVSLVLILAIVDGLVTGWFDSHSRLKLFHAVYF